LNPWLGGQLLIIKYTVNCLKALKKAIQNNSRDILTSGIVFLHDNARPHSAQVTKDFLGQFRWNIFNHPSSSPDLTTQRLLYIHPYEEEAWISAIW